MDTKVCHLCGVEKPLSDFYRSAGMRDGHRNDCKVCNLADKKKRYDADPQAHIDLGKFRDEPDLLLRAVDYLREGGFLELLAG